MSKNSAYMQSKKLLIVFVKNILLGKVKTRLAKSIGDYAAFEVYKDLVEITENETKKLKNFADIHIYFSDVIIDTKWPNTQKYVQEGDDLGARMKQAFKHGFDKGYTHIIGVGSDLPDLTGEVMKEGLTALEKSDTVFGPANDGGYYLIGMNELYHSIFDDKPWSTDQLLDVTLLELSSNDIGYTLLNELNDIDTFEDLKSSSIGYKYKHLYELSKSNK